MSMGDGNATHLGRGVESRGEAGRRRGGKKEDNKRGREREGGERGERLAWLCLLHWQAKGGRQARQPGSPLEE